MRIYEVIYESRGQESGGGQHLKKMVKKWAENSLKWPKEGQLLTKNGLKMSK